VQPLGSDHTNHGENKENRDAAKSKEAEKILRQKMGPAVLFLQVRHVVCLAVDSALSAWVYLTTKMLPE
jgi:hypothetical protein